ncbi:bifunctional biotin--[acetyl-CoA-carboxylase] ligase/biotin operon repressor BirA [Thiorhodovibrio frisius]|uniref:Bifunctional ligase/repressor BirA n=1 Tax=Thiorhodovibrio frisius TaxID=631362 RepID=H8YVN5_9GAMM|nr:bifunctional biotin--[acetyl-CoA-carboxylase] ligase/biotin operon repressor BirA [Thiorhodovibrio frisius]EIC23975.1 birA, biotin-(acetyl-CoA-carboxylase) ligase [Thiorhodovibrio frisius]WPL23048.1 Bifunctional protein BirA [Thiorhodovibrio frisius]
METEAQLIRLLADGKRHSGAALAAQLGISRAAVWKAVQRARERLDIEILAEQGQGYQLKAPLELLDAQEIESRLPPAAKERIGPIQCFAQIDSTNTWLLEQSTQGATSGTCVLAERQTAGRGRRGRAWCSPFGANLYLSILWYFDAGPATLGALSLAAGAAVAQALESLGITGIQLKWPNDIHWQQRKLGGLLIEIAGETQGPSRAVIGLGLNLQMPETAAKTIDQPWVDLREICQNPIPQDQIPQQHSATRNTIAACCIDQLSAMLASFPEQGPAPFLSAWRRFDAYRDQRASLHWSQHCLQGTYRGIDDQGALLLQIGQETRHFAAGELSLRPGQPS